MFKEENLYWEQSLSLSFDHTAKVLTGRDSKRVFAPSEMTERQTILTKQLEKAGENTLLISHYLSPLLT